MKNLWIILLIAFVIAGCGSSDAAQPLPDLLEPSDVAPPVDDSPRGEATPDSGLPPTWTPAPQTGAGHVFDVSGQQEVQVTGTRTIHIVRPGDTLGQIAERYGVSVADLARVNNIQNINIIEVGDELIIP